jgi:hypothetical protein
MNSMGEIDVSPIVPLQNAPVQALRAVPLKSRAIAGSPE